MFCKIDPNLRIFTITRITSNHSNILGVSFLDASESEIVPQLVPWNFKKNIPFEDLNCISETTEKEILYQVSTGLTKMNENLNTTYHLSKIYYQPLENTSNMIYRVLILRLIEHFFETKELNSFTKY